MARSGQGCARGWAVAWQALGAGRIGSPAHGAGLWQRTRSEVAVHMECRCAYKGRWLARERAWSGAAPRLRARIGAGCRRVRWRAWGVAAPRLRARIGVMVAHSGWGGGGHGDRMTQRSRRGDQEINSILMRICKFISRACDYGLTRDVGSERRFVVD